MATDIFIRSKVAIKDGKLDEFRAAWEAVEERAASEPGTLHYVAYIDEKSGDVASIEHFVDNDALMAHFENGADLFPALFESCDPTGLEVYGELNDVSREAMAPFESMLTIYGRVTAG
jgi:quinol monooxygenase YgiN